jgi:hydroxymethylpyrimidine/phosphomethylpyrimidine kinase
MPMICCGEMVDISGSTESGSTIRTHGTGCTLSSAIASNLAKEYDLDESVERAKKYISGALAAMLDLGKGSGPMNHGFAIKNEYTESKVEE